MKIKYNVIIEKKLIWKTYKYIYHYHIQIYKYD